MAPKGVMRRTHISRDYTRISMLWASTASEDFVRQGLGCSSVAFILTKQQMIQIAC
jgi:hypothetical protein